jgi:hypothetical protein
MAQYVPYYALIAAPLHKLTRNGEVFPTGSKWIPGSDYDLAYHHVRSLMLDRPLYIWNKDNERHSFIEVDACDDGWGACFYRHADEAPPNGDEDRFFLLSKKPKRIINSMGVQGMDQQREEKPSRLLQRDDRSDPRIRALSQPHRDPGPRAWSRMLLRSSPRNQRHISEQQG